MGDNELNNGEGHTHPLGTGHGPIATYRLYVCRPGRYLRRKEFFAQSTVDLL